MAVVAGFGDDDAAAATFCDANIDSRPPSILLLFRCSTLLLNDEKIDERAVVVDNLIIVERRFIKC